MIVLYSPDLQNANRRNLLMHCSPAKKIHLQLSLSLPKLTDMECGMRALELDGVG
jgi:hypothetical protein